MTIEKLYNLNFKTTSKGFIYLLDAINLFEKNNLINIGTIYYKLANKYNTNTHCIERAIRYCIESSNNEYNTLSNSQVITRLGFLGE